MREGSFQNCFWISWARASLGMSRASLCSSLEATGDCMTFLRETFFPCLKILVNSRHSGLGIWWLSFALTTSKVSSAKSRIKSTRPDAISMLSPRLTSFFSLSTRLLSWRRISFWRARSASTSWILARRFYSAASFWTLRFSSIVKATFYLIK